MHSPASLRRAYRRPVTIREHGAVLTYWADGSVEWYLDAPGAWIVHVTPGTARSRAAFLRYKVSFLAPEIAPAAQTPGAILILSIVGAR